MFVVAQYIETCLSINISRIYVKVKYSLMIVFEYIFIDIEKKRLAVADQPLL